MSKEWNKGYIGKLIEMYRERPCLWKVGHKDYMNSTAKSKAYDEILVEFRKYFPIATLELLKAKIQNMRSSYRKEIKKIERSKRSGNEIYKPRLWYFDLLEFSMNQDSPRHRPRPRRRYYNSPPEDDNEDGDFHDAYIIDDKNEGSEGEGSQCEMIDVVANERLREDKEAESTVTVSQQQNFDGTKHNRELLARLSQPKENDEGLSNMVVEGATTNECSVFGTYVSQKLRRMDDYQQILAEALIQKVLTKGLRTQLTDYSDLLDTIEDIGGSESADSNSESIDGEIYEYTGSGLSRIERI